MNQKNITIIGSGPAGMACAYTLSQAGHKPIIIERNSTPGGLCRTLDFDGYLFDIGGHRFLSKSEEINQLWKSIMGDDMLHVKRLSRIYYKKRYFDYPLSFINTFWNLGPFECFFCVISLLWAKYRKTADDGTFEGWIINRFGKRLYNIFFKTYTEKVWATACADIHSDWAIQRIRGLSLKRAIRKAILKSKAKTPKTLAEEFLYPRTGPGEFYNRLMQQIKGLGGTFCMGTTVKGIRSENGIIKSIEMQDRRAQLTHDISVDYLFSTMPLPILVRYIQPRAPDDVIDVAKELKFRSFLVVNVILDKKKIFPDQWIYVHEPNVRLGRIQNYKNWSPSMVVDQSKTSLGLEYLCTENDQLWSMNDIDLINYAMKELEQIGISSRKSLINGFVVRLPNVYPIYSLDYQEKIKKVRNYLDEFSNLRTLGREGLFRYDNSDHALLTGIYAASNYLGNSSQDLWSINADREYLES